MNHTNQKSYKVLVFKLVVILFIIFFILNSLNRINWIKILKINKIENETNQKLGDFCLKSIKIHETEITDSYIKKVVDSLSYPIFTSNNIDPKKIKFHIIKSEEVNAFAIPGNKIIILSGLINSCLNEAEFQGIICHEIAHIEKKHISQKLIKDFAVNNITENITGINNEKINRILEKLSSTAYDRALESEADYTSIKYLTKSKINPVFFADFLLRISNKENNNFEFISTHPNSRKRAQLIYKSCKNQNRVKSNKHIESSTWVTFKKKLFSIK